MLKFSGKELFELGCPQNKIKLFVNKEFESVDELTKLFANKESTNKVEYSDDSAYLFLLEIRDKISLPLSIEGKHLGQPSNGEVKRWLENKAVKINGKFPLPNDNIYHPIKELVFFPNGKRKTTYC